MGKTWIGWRICKQQLWAVGVSDGSGWHDPNLDMVPPNGYRNRENDDKPWHFGNIFRFGPYVWEFYFSTNQSMYPLVNVYILRTGKSQCYQWVIPLFRLGHFQ